MINKLIIIIIYFVLSNKGYAEILMEGQRYKISKSIYIMGQYNDVKNKKLTKETAVAYLNSVKLATRYFTAFQSEVPAGTIITILSRANKPWYLYFSPDYYFVTLSPDVSQGLDVKLPLIGSFEGSLDGLNSEFFSRL